MAHYYQITESPPVVTPCRIHNTWVAADYRSILLSLEKFFQCATQTHPAYIITIHTFLYAPDKEVNRVFILQGEIVAVSPLLRSVTEAKDYLKVIMEISSLFLS